MEEPSGLQSMGLQRVGHNWVTSRSRWGFSAVYAFQGHFLDCDAYLIRVSYPCFRGLSSFICIASQITQMPPRSGSLESSPWQALSSSCLKTCKYEVPQKHEKILGWSKSLFEFFHMNFLANPILRLGEKNIKTVFFTVIDNLFLFANPACASEFFSHGTFQIILNNI